MIKILFLIPDISGGGAEKVLCNLVNNMDQSEFDITVQTINDCDSEKYLSHGIHYKSIIKCKSKLGRKIFSYWFRFCAEMKWAYNLFIKDDYDIEVAYLETSPTKLIAQSTNKKAAKIAWVHCDVIKKGLCGEKIHSQYRQFNIIICVSQDCRNSFQKIFPDIKNIDVLYNVIDDKEIEDKITRSPLTWNDDTFHIVTVGRLSWEKGCDRIIEVASLLKEEGYSFMWHIVGDGPEKEKLEDLVKENNLSNNIVFEGFTDNPYSYMKNADLIAIPSRTEALSTVAIESLILGKMVVTTPCSGMRELFGNSQYGIITEDSVQSLFDNISRLIRKPELREEYIRASEKRGYDFNKKTVISNTSAMFISQIL